jgi:hypothetical protein
VSGFGCRVSGQTGFGCRVSGQTGFGFWVLGFGFWVLGFGFWVLGFGFWVLGFGFWVLVERVFVAGTGQPFSQKPLARIQTAFRSETITENPKPV